MSIYFCCQVMLVSVVGLITEQIMPKKFDGLTVLLQCVINCFAALALLELYVSQT
jgi:hypothetical protein